MTGYTPNEKLQLCALQHCWLKDQELSPREPVLPPPKLRPVASFWEHFLQPGSVAAADFQAVQMKPKVFPGVRILETGEIIPPMEEEPTGHH
uniref:NADH dehydrogenase [ubiquinone] 1 beta subcomplex subunit 6 n=1 Tax=Chelonoidis abingdonii TaxID=106734 RepID=A0A8C0IMD1_CHEAB